MSHGNWGPPAILSLLLQVQKRVQLARAASINEQLMRAKALLEMHIRRGKVSNGK